MVEIKDLLWFWNIERQYSTEEFDQAELYRLIFRPGSVMDTGGAEECYDFTDMCQECGAGRVQRTPLQLGHRYFPKKARVARTHSHEIVFAEEVVNILIEAGLAGFEFQPLLLNQGGAPVSPLAPSWKAILKRARAAGVEPYSVDFTEWGIADKESAELFHKNP